MATIDKLNYVSETKDRLKTVANYAEADISTDTFRSYPEKIYNSYIDIINEDIDIKADLPKLNSEGTSIDIEDALDEPLIDFSLYGETQQDSTTGKNLFDVNANHSNSRCTSNINNNQITNTNSGTWAYVKYGFNTIVGQTYTLSTNYINSNASYVGLVIRDSNDNVITNTSYINSTSGALIISFTATTTTTNLQLYSNASNNSNNYVVSFSNIQLEKGSNKTDYEPYTNGASPNPNYPQPIHNVSGDNTIEICGKNILPLSASDLTLNRYIGNDGSEQTSTTGNYYGSYTYIDFNFGGKTIALSDGLELAFYDSSKTFISYVGRNQSRVQNVPNNCSYIRIDCYKDNINEMQIEFNSSQTPYEAYTGNSQLISLGVENLFDKSTITTINNGTITNDIITSNAISSGYGGVSANINGLTLQAGTYYISLKLKRDSGTSGNKLTRITFLGIDTSLITMIDNPTITNDYQIYTCKITPTETITITNIGIQLQPTNIDAVISYTDIMVSKSMSEYYYSYGTTPIELNKIDTYQDYIYKENDRWFLHKEIGKFVLDGSENWNNDNGTQGTDYRHNIIVSRLNIPTPKDIGNSYMSNYFSVQPRYNDVGELGKFYLAPNWLVFVDKNKVYDLDQWKNWLSTHNTIVYYVLATPTDTEITDTTLLEQLNNLMTLPLYKNLTHITLTPNDLQPTMKIATIKSYNTLWQEEE